MSQQFLHQSKDRRLGLESNSFSDGRRTDAWDSSRLGLEPNCFIVGRQTDACDSIRIGLNLNSSASVDGQTSGTRVDWDLSQSTVLEYSVQKSSVSHIFGNTGIENNSGYEMILGRDLLTALGLDLKLSEKIIIGGDGTYEGCPAPMIDLNNYEFKSLTDKMIKPEESFINLYVGKCLKPKSTISSTHRICRFLDTKYKKADLNEDMT